jgi:Flp pilus assembly protein TadD
VEVLRARGLALARLGRFDEALASFARARGVNPSDAGLHVDVGTVRLMSGDREGARGSFEAALAQNPAVARAHSSLGFLLAEGGRDVEALAHWRTALALDPDESARLMGLAGLLLERGRGAQARPYVELFVSTAPERRYAREIERARRWLAGGAAPRGSSVP